MIGQIILIAYQTPILYPTASSQTPETRRQAGVGVSGFRANSSCWLYCGKRPIGNWHSGICCLAPVDYLIKCCDFSGSLLSTGAIGIY